MSIRDVFLKAMYIFVSFEKLSHTFPTFLGKQDKPETTQFQKKTKQTTKIGLSVVVVILVKKLA